VTLRWSLRPTDTAPGGGACGPRWGSRWSSERPPCTSVESSKAFEGQSSASKRTRTCFGTPAATRSPTRGATRERYRLTLGTGTSSTRCATLNCRRHGSRIFGARNVAAETLLLKGRAVATAGSPRVGRPFCATASEAPPGSNAAAIVRIFKLVTNNYACTTLKRER
jgi:hypothetical protein